MNNLRSWYDERVPIYKPLVESIENKCREILDKEAIHYIQIEARLKTFDSFEKKVIRKGYRKPEEVTDLAGVMIVGSVLSNAECRYIMQWFSRNSSIVNYNMILQIVISFFHRCQH